MKYKEAVIIGIIALLIIYFGIKIEIDDFNFIDGILIIPALALPIAFLMHLLGIVMQNTLKIKYSYLISFVAYVIGLLVIVQVNTQNEIFDGVLGFILLFILYPSFIFHLSIVIYYVCTKKRIFSADY